jgi:hypothetical protein
MLGGRKFSKAHDVQRGDLLILPELCIRTGYSNDVEQMAQCLKSILSFVLLMKSVPAWTIQSLDKMSSILLLPSCGYKEATEASLEVCLLTIAALKDLQSGNTT